MSTSPEPLWRPSPRRAGRSRLAGFQRWLAETRGVPTSGYDELWRWSVGDLDAFWRAVWDFFAVRSAAPPVAVLAERAMPGARWFPGVELNYAEHALAAAADPAVVFRGEDGRALELGAADLRRLVASVSAGLRELGVGRGDRVAGLLPNIPEALVAFLATASLGAVWTSCSPDFGVHSVQDRFAQVAPKVLVAVDGYRYGGREFDVTPTVRELQQRLPELSATVVVRNAGTGQVAGAVPWERLAEHPGELRIEPVPFDHPLWILYSSGTTGLPKAIVQGHGGILVEHLKALALHTDLGPGERFFWFTTTGWMMWNFLVSGLTVGATVVLYDGSPAFPDLGALWRLAGEVGITSFGTSAPFLQSCLKAGLRPAQVADLSRLRTVGSTGAPLSPEGFRYVYDAVGEDLLLASVSGGTDLCTAFVGSAPTLPVYAGELQCRMLGADVQAYDEAGRPLLDEVGELVITQPMPSMPLCFWNDPGGARLRESYFDTYPGVWRHGDWIRITPRGSAVIYGRSDATLNRGGVRMGTSEFYRVVEELPEVADSLVVDTSGPDGGGELWLFVVPAAGSQVDEAALERLRARIRTELSPRHVPDRVELVPAVPRTLNGKKCEIPVKRILSGVPVERVVSAGALADPAALEPFVRLAAQRDPGA